MKKLFYFIAIASISTLGFTSCSEDDPVMEIPAPNPNPNVGEQLKISSDATYIEDLDIFFIELGKSVKFTTTSGSNTIDDVKVQAKRAGYIDSNILTIQFAQKPYK